MGFGRGGKGDFEKGVEEENWKLEIGLPEIDDV